MSDFEKLDAFVKRNVPEPKTGLKPLRLPKKPSLFWGLLASGTLAVVLTFVNVGQRLEKLESATVLADTLSWDVTTDEMPLEVDEALAFVDEVE